MTQQIRKVAIIGDSHFCESSRFEECIRLHAWIQASLAAVGVDLVLHTGDLYDRRSTPRERDAVADWVGDVAQVAPVVIVRGNHDAPGDIDYLGRLRTVHPVTAVETAQVVEAGGCLVAAVGWPTRAGLDGELVGLAEGHASAGEAMRAVLRGLGDGMRLRGNTNTPHLLAMHAMVRGSVTSTGQPLVGCDLEVGLEDLALARADLYALGHIHKGQRWEIDGAPVIYPGSPRRTAFGEVEPKGYVLARFEGRRLLAAEFVEAPATPMVALEADWRHGGLVLDGTAPDVSGAEVRLRYRVPSDQRDAARACAEVMRRAMVGDGAVIVKVEEEVTATTRARAPEVAAAKTLAEKLAALWRSRGESVSPEREERLLARLARLEEEATHAA